MNSGLQNNLFSFKGTSLYQGCSSRLNLVENYPENLNIKQALEDLEPYRNELIYLNAF